MSDDRTRAPALWVVGILAILLGMLGSCGGLFGIGGPLLQDSVLAAQQDLLDRVGQTDEQAQRQLEIQRISVEIARRYRVPTMSGQLLNLVSSFALIIGAILLFRWSPSTFAVIAAACVGSALADVIVGVVGVLVQQESAEAMAALLGGSGDPQADRVAQGVFRASGTFGICFAAGWLVAKLAFYAGALLYLRRPAVRAEFAAA